MLMSRGSLPDIYVPPSLYKSYAARSGDSPKYTVFHWTFTRIFLDFPGFAQCDPQMCQTTFVSNLTDPTSQSNVIEVLYNNLKSASFGNRLYITLFEAQIKLSSSKV